MERREWRYGTAALLGFIVGTLLFVLHQILSTGDPGQEMSDLAVSTVAGAWAAWTITLLHNAALRRARKRHERQRQIWIMAKHEPPVSE